MGNVKKSVAERTRHKRQYDRRMNKRQMQSRESKVISSKALDASLVVIECSGTKSDEHITSSSLETYIRHVVDAYIRPINDQESSAEVHLTAQHNVLANEQHHTDQSEPSYDTHLLEKVDSNTALDSTNMCHRGGEIDQDARSKVNSRAKVQSLKSRNNIKPTKRIPNVNKSERWISKGYRFSPNKSYVVHEKPNTPRSWLRWKLTGRIFKTAGLRWIPTGKMFIDCITKVDSEPLNGSNDDITNAYECDQTLNVSAVSPTPYVPPSKKDYEILFQPLFDEYFNPPPHVVSLISETVVASRVVDPAGSPLSTTIDQDVPSASTSPTIQEIHSQVTHQGAEGQMHGHQNA
nr:hypothetical protein [Tanacetum cinerariifolium]